MLFFQYSLLLCIGAILKTKSTPKMIKPVSIWGRGKHDKHVMIHFSCYLCKTKVFSYKTYTLINFVSFDEYNKWGFFFFFHFVSGQFKERVYGRIHLSFRYISRWDHSSAARSPNVPNYMWSCRKRCAYISKYIYRQDRSENEKQIYHTVGICEMVLFYANWAFVRVIN